MHEAPRSPARRWRHRTGVLAATVLVAVVLPVVATSPATADPAATTDPAAAAGIDTSDRDAVLQAYQQTWYPATKTATGWTGSTASCTPGVDSTRAQGATLRAVNFARALAGRRPVTMDATLSAAAMRAALISQANNTLSHSPDPSSRCWTQAGADAAGSSNLYGVAGSAITAATPIESYLDDPGGGNNFAGHRRWILFSRLAKIGSGTTTGANALYVIDQPSWLGSPAGSKVAAWPSAGYFPASLEPGGRWSVSIPGADFSTATVSVRKGSTALATTVTSRSDNGYGDNSLVWSVDPRYDISQGDQAYTVTISGYRIGGVAKNTRYTTTLFDATVGLPDRHVIVFAYPTAKRVGVTFDPGATDSLGAPVYYFSNTQDICTTSFNPSRVTTKAPGTCSVFAYSGSVAGYPDAPYETRSFTVTG